jgi:hypothetical protein
VFCVLSLWEIFIIANGHDTSPGLFLRVPSMTSKELTEGSLYALLVFLHDNGLALRV